MKNQIQEIKDGVEGTGASFWIVIWLFVAGWISYILFPEMTLQIGILWAIFATYKHVSLYYEGADCPLYMAPGAFFYGLLAPYAGMYIAYCGRVSEKDSES